MRHFSNLILLSLASGQALSTEPVLSSQSWRPSLKLSGSEGLLPKPKATQVQRLRGGGGMKIAICSWESMHAVAVGGVAAHVTELGAGLQRRGHEVHVYTRATENQMGHEVIDGVHIHRVPIELNPDFVKECNNMCNSFVYFMKDTETHMMKEFDLVHCHDWLTAKALVQMKQAGRQCVFTMHSTEFGRCGNQHYDGVSAAIRDFEREGCEYADKVIAVSGRLCDEVKDQFGCHEKLRMVYNGVQLHHFEGFIDPGALKGDLGIGPFQPMILFVGRMATQKGPDLLIEAMPTILGQRGDAVAVLVGDGYMRQDLETRVGELGIGHAVRFMGSAKGPALANYYKAADCVVVPSRNEPFGIVVLEAWACGKVPVVTTSGGPGEFVRHGEDGFHVHPDSGSISWGISQVLCDFDRAKGMGLAGRGRCETEFSWDHIAWQTENVYSEAKG